jgi:predicted DNA-binding WGR domain protein
MTALTLYKVDPERNMRRFYRLDVQPDLFGLWLFMREWGRIGRPGQTREIAFPTIDEARRALERQRRAKERRGYSNIEWRSKGRDELQKPEGTYEGVTCIPRRETS